MAPAPQRRPHRHVGSIREWSCAQHSRRTERCPVLAHVSVDGGGISAARRGGRRCGGVRARGTPHARRSICTLSPVLLAIPMPTGLARTQIAASTHGSGKPNGTRTGNVVQLPAAWTHSHGQAIGDNAWVQPSSMCRNKSGWTRRVLPAFLGVLQKDVEPRSGCPPFGPVRTCRRANPAGDRARACTRQGHTRTGGWRQEGREVNRNMFMRQGAYPGS